MVQCFRYMSSRKRKHTAPGDATVNAGNDDTDEIKSTDHKRNRVVVEEASNGRTVEKPSNGSAVAAPSNEAESDANDKMAALTLMSRVEVIGFRDYLVICGIQPSDFLNGGKLIVESFGKHATSRGSGLCR